MTKQQSLTAVAHEIASCSLCQEQTMGKPVPGEGNPDAKVIFVGEAPGKQEAQTGRPFIGRSGQLLRRYIRDIGLSEQEVFITSALKYLPERGTPTPGQIEIARPHLLKQLAIIKPKIVVLLGKMAAKSLLKRDIPIKTEHGRVFVEDNTHYLLMFHPAAVVRFPPLLKEFSEDFHTLQQLLQAQK